MDGDPGERGKNAHRLHRLGAPLRVDREQGVLAGPGTVHPAEPAVHAEPGFVEPGHLAARGLLAGVFQERGEPSGRAVMPATVPDDSGMPNSSAGACAVRFFDRNCPVYR